MKKNGKSAGDIDLGRRNLLQASAAGLFAGISIGFLSGAPSAQAARAESGIPGVLIVYYSRTGNTRAVARSIHEQAGGDIVELQTVHPYPDEYRATTEQAKRELETGYKPPLKTNIPHLDAYGVIFVGSPCWWGTVAAPVITFLSDYDLSNKTIAPFMTHEGSGLGRTVAHIKRLCPRAAVTEGLAIRGSRAGFAQEDVRRWLRDIGLAER